ncbi:hypothetical protein [Thermococcus sp. ES12]|uniref:hypothetical protein n=1 Tax=Thermococcus sp. ES12 TaxID=1638246 RepID=UPI00142F40B5|nr:hypothetical protein [Thermococcus sp. ES12]NJE75639.1 hypothetical protein [Thermococcus sp. ES12]
MERSGYVLGVIILAGLSIRLALAPYSAGSDLAQFYGFAGTMLEKKACFYSYADAIGFWDKGWPYPWPYVYGPVMAYILALLRYAVNGSVRAFWSGGSYHVYVDPTWAFSVKLVFLLADTLVAVLLYLLLRERSQKLAILGVALYYLNPITIHVSAVYGMFDGLALAFFLLGLYLSRRTRVSYALYGFSLAVKQTLVFPAVLSLWDAVLRGRKAAPRIAFFLLGGLLPFLPMILLCPSSLGALPGLMKGLNVSYTLPLSYSMNGVSSLATYIHLTKGSDTLPVLQHWYVPSLLLLALVFIRHSFNRNPAISAALAYAVFVSTYWRVNPQYLVPLVAFMILLAALEDGVITILSLFTAVYAGIWPVMQPSSFWFHVHMENPNWTLVHIVDSLTFRVFTDGPYVAYSIGLTLLLYAVILTATIPYLKNLKSWLAERVRVRA